MNWLTNLEQAKEESLKSHKPILLQLKWIFAVVVKK